MAIFTTILVALRLKAGAGVVAVVQAPFPVYRILAEGFVTHRSRGDEFVTHRGRTETQVTHRVSRLEAE